MGKNNLFASHRGQKIKKMSKGAVVALVLLGVANNFIAGQVSQTRSQDTLTASQSALIDFKQVRTYPSPTESSMASQGASEGSTEEEQAETLKQEVKDLAQKAIQTWVNYDYTQEFMLGNIGGQAEEGREGYNSTQELSNRKNEEIKNSEAKSTGNVSATEIVSMNYEGSLSGGKGEALIKVSAQQTVIDKNTGQAGKTSTQAYLVKLVKNQVTQGVSEWVIRDIQAEN